MGGNATTVCQRQPRKPGRDGAYEKEQPEEQTVKVTREDAQVVVCRGGHAVEQRRDGIEDEHRCSVRDEETG